MSEVQVAVLYGFGINCDRETAAVFELVGAKSTRVHLNEFISKSLDIHQFDILAIPGGFSFGGRETFGLFYSNPWIYGDHVSLSADMAKTDFQHPYFR